MSRQISRDGQSKYYLNKSEILLRDLIDFFAKARLVPVDSSSSGKGTAIFLSARRRLNAAR